MIIRILLADGHALLRNGLKRLFSETADIVVVAEASDGLDALEKMRHSEWDVALLDVSMPGMNGLEVLKRIMADDAQRRVLMLSMYSEDEYAIRAMRAGASAYLTKDSPTELLMSVIRRWPRSCCSIPSFPRKPRCTPRSPIGSCMFSD